MEKTTKKKLLKMAVASLYSALFFAIFWGIWSCFAPVPALTEIKWSNASASAWHPPFAISRWWDVLFAPLCVSAGFDFYFFLTSTWFDDLYDILEEKIGDYATETLAVLALLTFCIGALFTLFQIIFSAVIVFFAVLALTFSIIIIFGLIAGLIWLIRWFVRFNQKIFGSDSH